MEYEGAAVAIFIIIVLVSIIVFIALLYSIYYINHDSNNESTDKINDDNLNTCKSEIKYPDLLFLNRKQMNKKNSYVLSISDDFSLKDNIENNKLILLVGKITSSINLPDNDTDGIILNFFNDSYVKHSIKTNSCIMSSESSDNNIYINPGEYITLINTGKFWIITSRFGGTKSTNNEIIKVKNNDTTIIFKDEETSVETELHNLLNSEWN